MSESRHQNKERTDGGYMAFINIHILGKYEKEKQMSLLLILLLVILRKIQQSEIRGKNKCEMIFPLFLHI